MVIKISQQLSQRPSEQLKRMVSHKPTNTEPEMITEPETTTYINTIDNAIDFIILKFYAQMKEKQYSSKSNSIDNIKKNFRIFYDLINELISKTNEYFKIDTLVTDHNNQIIINEILFEYVFTFFMFYISTSFNTNDIFDLINNILNEYSIKIRFISQYEYYYNLIHNTIKSLEGDYVENQIISIEMFNQIKEDKENQLFQIIRLIIFREIYLKEDKKTIFDMLEHEDILNAEWKYIDIVDTVFTTFDYATIETLFDGDHLIAENIFNIVHDYESNKLKKDYDINSKINYLFERKLLIPITNDFLRYHKESELYDKISNISTNKKERIGKKGDTKIKYIITKTNSIKDFYLPKIQANQQLKTEIEHYFYQPLIYRKATLINDTEEVNILRKLELHGTFITEQDEYYTDLKYIRTYPFIEFRTIENNSFTFEPTATYIAARKVNFEYKDNPNFQHILRTNIQYRIIDNGMKPNIVGVILPKITPLHKKGKRTIIQCDKLINSKDISIINENSLTIALNYLQTLIMNSKKYHKLHYWLFNRDKDIFTSELFTNIKQLTDNEYIKLLMGKIFDEIIQFTFLKIQSKLNSSDNINIYSAKKIINLIESKLLIIPRHSVLYYELEKIMYYITTVSNINPHDEKDDNIITEFIKLPVVTLEKILIHVIKIAAKKLSGDNEDDYEMYEGYLCQHIIAWNNLLKYKKYDPNKFNQSIYEFITKYVTQNKDKEFVCKSCYQLVDLKNYTVDTYPGSDRIVISYGLDTELETMPEYTVFTKSIRNMEQIIEKISYSSNLSYFVGSGTQIKLRRQEVIKNIIDMIETQYKTLFTKDAGSNRFNAAVKNYGCSMSKFFLFKIDNEIFTFSSKETDKFKLAKRNNIYVYVLMYLLLELNSQQILYLNFDKVVNYFLFNKYGFNLFDNLYIRISNKNDLAPIKNYKLLCYVVYYLAGIFTKFNMWYIDNVQTKPNTINPTTQRIVIHTFVDAINTILEVNTRENKGYVYSTFAAKFFSKLSLVYDNNISIDVINKLDDISKKKTNIIDDKKIIYSRVTVPTIPVVDYIVDGAYMFQSIYGTKSKIGYYPSIFIEHTKLRDMIITKLILPEKLTELKHNMYLSSLYQTAILYDINGIKRNVQIGLDDVKKLDIKQLEQIAVQSTKFRLKNWEQSQSLLTEPDIKLSIVEPKDITTNIRDFVDKLELIIGTDVNINNNNIYLKRYAYEIDHDYRGTKKEAFIVLDDKIKFKRNDHIFNQDIYVYDDSNNKVTIYYSAIEKYMIGYKELSKEIVKVINTDCYIKIHYPILYQLKYFGFNYMFFNINTVKNITQFINNTMKIRLHNLKNAMSIIQQIIYQVKNNFIGSTLNPIAKYYQTKIKSINVYDDDGTKIFDQWNALTNLLFYNDIELSENINILILQNENKYMPVETLVKFSSADNIVLGYIISQLTILLDINYETYTKTNIVYMIVNIIMQLFRNYTNFENATYNINVKRFYRSITTIAEVTEIHDEFAHLSDEEVEKIKEDQELAQESIDALDADQDSINEDFGDEEVQLQDRTSDDY